MGFMIKDMKIHTSVSSKVGHYNRHRRGDVVNVNKLLEVNELLCPLLKQAFTYFLTFSFRKEDS